jgi:hypothetical protein
MLSVVLLCHYNEYAPVSYNGGPQGAKPYRCPSCRRVGLTPLLRPRCFGQSGAPHDPALMNRVPESFREQAVKLIIK